MPAIELKSNLHTTQQSKMGQILLNPDFDEVLEPYGSHAAEFFLAASLYHAHKISFGAAAQLAGLTFDEFHHRLKEHFSLSYFFDDEVVLEDIETVDKLYISPKILKSVKISLHNTPTKNGNN